MFIDFLTVLFIFWMSALFVHCFLTIWDLREHLYEQNGYKNCLFNWSIIIISPLVAIAILAFRGELSIGENRGKVEPVACYMVDKPEELTND